MSRCLSLRWKFNKPKHMKIHYDILFMCKYILYIITYMQLSYASYRCYFSFFLCSFCSYKFLPSSNEPASRTRKTILLQLDKLTASSTNINISEGAAHGGVLFFFPNAYKVVFKLQEGGGAQLFYYPFPPCLRVGEAQLYYPPHPSGIMASSASSNASLELERICVSFFFF